jgi:hypothetical protein
MHPYDRMKMILGLLPHKNFNHNLNHEEYKCVYVYSVLLKIVKVIKNKKLITRKELSVVTHLMLLEKYIKHASTQ